MRAAPALTESAASPGPLSAAASAPPNSAPPQHHARTCSASVQECASGQLRPWTGAAVATVSSRLPATSASSRLQLSGRGTCPPRTFAPQPSLAALAGSPASCGRSRTPLLESLAMHQTVTGQRAGKALLPHCRATIPLGLQLLATPKTKIRGTKVAAVDLRSHSAAASVPSGSAAGGHADAACRKIGADAGGFPSACTGHGGLSNAGGCLEAGVGAGSGRVGRIYSRASRTC